jgi:hypothetical protein
MTQCVPMSILGTTVEIRGIVGTSLKLGILAICRQTSQWNPRFASCCLHQRSIKTWLYVQHAVLEVQKTDEHPNNKSFNVTFFLLDLFCQRRRLEQVIKRVLCLW